MRAVAALAFSHVPPRCWYHIRDSVCTLLCKQKPLKLNPYLP
jgi:hypothetical protein